MQKSERFFVYREVYVYDIKGFVVDLDDYGVDTIDMFFVDLWVYPRAFMDVSGAIGHVVGGKNHIIVFGVGRFFSACDSLFLNHNYENVGRYVNILDV